MPDLEPTLETALETARARLRHELLDTASGTTAVGAATGLADPALLTGPTPGPPADPVLSLPTSPISGPPADPVPDLLAGPVLGSPAGPGTDGPSPLVSRLGADGTWPDLDYADRGDGRNWAPLEHLSRTLSLALTPQHHPSALSALDAWRRHGPRSANWWYNEIAAPQLAGDALLLLADRLDPAERTAWGAWLAGCASSWEMTGQNLVWTQAVVLRHGLLVDDADLLSSAVARMATTLRPTHGEGIQDDFSFHQHGAQLYSGGYGFALAADLGLWIYVVYGTPWAFGGAEVGFFTDFLLEGLQWAIHGGAFDFTTMGRNITRADAHRPTPDLRTAIRRLRASGAPRQAELAAFEQRLAEAEQPPAERTAVTAAGLAAGIAARPASETALGSTPEATAGTPLGSATGPSLGSTPETALGSALGCAAEPAPGSTPEAAAGTALGSTAGPTPSPTPRDTAGPALGSGAGSEASRLPAGTEGVQPAARTEAARPAAGPVGCRYYPRSDYLVHRRPGWSVSVRMSSTRTAPTESMNGENLRGRHLGDGVAPIRVGDGPEDGYRAVIPLWDWARLPGVTAEQPSDPAALLPRPNDRHGASPDVDGWTDGRHGMAVMRLAGTDRIADGWKAWFCFDDVFVALGAGITAPSATYRVVTTIDQRLATGPLTIGPLTDGPGTTGPGMTRAGTTGAEMTGAGTIGPGMTGLGTTEPFVHQGRIGYLPLSDRGSLSARVERRSGSWADITATGSTETLTAEVFTVGFDHGPRPADATYACLVLPGADAAATAARWADPGVTVLSNTPLLQSVRCDHSGVTLTAHHDARGLTFTRS
ncbi:polysaccharide lyase family 8 super-sandwich domain-containing protein [Nonomuraea sp. CA-143628]|uniref:polysaccharide lyase family 8 super-sandwich domain-containing protein n=1 Tax=Nonomuraea sp. CA-143628 TaxID=3239997 RepID=UPI003D8F6F83